MKIKWVHTGKGLETLASTQDPSPSPPASCYPPSPAWTIPLPRPPSLICSPHGSLSNLYKRERRCCLKPCDDSHHTQKEIHTPCLSPSTPACCILSARPPHVLGPSGGTRTAHLWTAGPSHCPYPYLLCSSQLFLGLASSRQSDVSLLQKALAGSQVE